MRRSGFTMIELIFVIVILGILASVAIPKLAATRDDAKISKALSELATLKGDLSSYYTSQGTYSADKKSLVTNVDLWGADCTDGNKLDSDDAIASGSTYRYCVPKSDGNLEEVVTIAVDDSDGNLTISNSAGVTGNIAKGLQAADTSLVGTIQNGGSKVNF